VHQAVDQRDDAGGVLRAVGGDQRAAKLVATGDQLEHQIGMAIGVGEIADLVDHQQFGAGIMAQAATQGGTPVERAEVAEPIVRRR
jgi:hypothetical protein